MADEFTPEQLQAVRDQMASPQEVEFGDRRVRNRPIDELLQIEQRIASDVATSTPRRRSRMMTAVGSKGF